MPRSAARGAEMAPAKLPKRATSARDRPHVPPRDDKEKRLEQVLVPERRAVATPEALAQPCAMAGDVAHAGLSRRGLRRVRSCVVDAHRPSEGEDRRGGRLRPYRADGVARRGRR